MTLDMNQKIGADLDAVKELYGQLLLLLDQSVREDPVIRASDELDRAIRQLTGVIDAKMARFREDVHQARKAKALSQPLEEAIANFETSLARGLGVMRERIGERAQSLTRQRDEVRTNLKKVRHKKSGMKAYAIPRQGGNFIESEI